MYRYVEASRDASKSESDVRGSDIYVVINTVCKL